MQEKQRDWLYFGIVSGANLLVLLVSAFLGKGEGLAFQLGMMGMILLLAVVNVLAGLVAFVAGRKPLGRAFLAASGVVVLVGGSVCVAMG